MDKKNTMLLTVIAVATLLVAVVGATFAYFSVANPQSSTTNVKASTGKIGVINIDEGKKDLELFVSTQDMAKLENDKSYYAISKASAEDNDGQSSGGIWSSDAVSPNVATIKLTGANETDTVKCDLSVLVTVKGTMAGNLKTGDAFVTLSGIEGLNGATSVDLAGSTFSYNGSSADEKTGTATFNLNNGKLEFKQNKLSYDLKADIWLVNKSKEAGVDQSYLAGKELTVEIQTTVSNCETTSAAAAA